MPAFLPAVATEPSPAFHFDGNDLTANMEVRMRFLLGLDNKTTVHTGQFKIVFLHEIVQ